MHLPASVNLCVSTCRVLSVIANTLHTDGVHTDAQHFSHSPYSTYLKLSDKQQIAKQDLSAKNNEKLKKKVLNYIHIFLTKLFNSSKY